MDDDSETFEEHYFVEQQTDGVTGRVIRSAATFSDGSNIVTEYEDVLPANDPYVRSRQCTVGEGPAREILTEFLPSPVRPPTYPAGFPFLAGRASHTTESPAGAMSPGARWPCRDPEAVLTALVEACQAAGWRMPAGNVHPMMRANLSVAFGRGNDLRLLHQVAHEQGSVIQMLDLVGGWFDDSANELTQEP